MAAFNRVSVIGAGAWGTALAGVAARAGREVTLYARDAATASTIAATRKNPRLPGVRIDRKIAITSDISLASRADVVKHGMGPDPRDPAERPLGKGPRDIFIPDLRLGSGIIPGEPVEGIKVRTRDFR